jgi:hypothetical protein
MRNNGTPFLAIRLATRLINRNSQTCLNKEQFCWPNTKISCVCCLFIAWMSWHPVAGRLVNCKLFG